MIYDFVALLKYIRQGTDILKSDEQWWFMPAGMGRKVRINIFIDIGVFFQKWNRSWPDYYEANKVFPQSQTV